MASNHKFFIHCLFVFIIISFCSGVLGQRIYKSGPNDDYYSTNTNYFILPNTTSNQGLDNPQKDFYSNLRLAAMMAEVSETGKEIEENQIRISRVKFATENTDPFGDFIQNLKMIIIEPKNTLTVNRPIILASIGGANANESEINFLYGISQWLMKGYVVAYYENPKKVGGQLGVYLGIRGFDTLRKPQDVYPGITYLGVQVATAAIKYLASNSSNYKIDSNKFYVMGHSFGALISMNLALGDSVNYYKDGNLKIPFNKLGIREKFLNAKMRAAQYKILGACLWGIGYPVDSNIYNNPYGNLIDSNDPKVIHFHGLKDAEVSYASNWLNNLKNFSIFCDGPTTVIPKFKEHNVPFKAFVNCNAGHPAFDINDFSSIDEVVLKKRISDYITSLDFNDILVSANKDKDMHQLTKFVFDQVSQMIDLSALYFQDQSLPNAYQDDINFIRTKDYDKDGTFQLSDCLSEGFCKNLNGFIGSPCDDFNNLTVRDSITPDCKCVGNFTSNIIQSGNGNLKIFPNPFSKKLYFFNGEIVSARIVFPTDHELQIDQTNSEINGIPEESGFYILELKNNEDKIYYRKVIRVN